MMNTLYQLEGSRFRIEVLQTEKVQQFIGRHAEILDSSFQQVKMSDAMRRRLKQSDYIFSGIKTFHELNEAFPSLLNPDGSRKPFEQFLNDVRKIDKTYNQHYLRAEYNLAQQSANMAAKWEQFLEDGDRYNLQYRTANDGRVRPEHAALNRVTLPITDPFWETYYPPNGWNCRCTVVQVRKGKYPETPHDDAMQLGEEATGKDKRGIFHFNPGIEQKTFPDYNPYTIRRCRDCDIAKGKLSLARPIVPENDLCEACRILRKQQKAVEKAVKEEEDKVHWQKVRELLKSGRFPVISGRNQYQEYENLYSGKLCVTNKKLRHLLSHTHTEEQMKAAEYIWNHPEKLHSPQKKEMEEYYRSIGMPEDVMWKKIEKKKRERKVVCYYYYKFTFKEEEWKAYLEYDEWGRESIYMVDKKSPDSQ